jgi:hypothetical protein
VADTPDSIIHRNGDRAHWCSVLLSLASTRASRFISDQRGQDFSELLIAGDWGGWRTLFASWNLLALTVICERLTG